MYRADLHIHTTASDGVFAPSQVVLRAKEHGVNLMAVSDHDSILGIGEAAEEAKRHEILLISAVEISTGDEGNIHVLGFGVRQDSQKLNALFSEMALERETRAERIVEKLNKIGLPLTMADIPAGKGAVKGRAQIARALLSKGYISTMQEAFDCYIGSGCPAYVGRTRRDTGDMIALLKEEGALPVLAHPGLMRMDRGIAERNIAVWKSRGLAGIEVYHPAHADSEFPYWHGVARKLGLLVTGGSDFHQPGDKHADIGEMLACWSSCDQDARALLKALT